MVVRDPEDFSENKNPPSEEKWVAVSNTLEVAFPEAYAVDHQSKIGSYFKYKLLGVWAECRVRAD
jgi:hypothetical protein